VQIFHASTLQRYWSELAQAKVVAEEVIGSGAVASIWAKYVIHLCHPSYLDCPSEKSWLVNILIYTVVDVTKMELSNLRWLLKLIHDTREYSYHCYQSASLRSSHPSLWHKTTVSAKVMISKWSLPHPPLFRIPLLLLYFPLIFMLPVTRLPPPSTEIRSHEAVICSVPHSPRTGLHRPPLLIMRSNPSVLLLIMGLKIVQTTGTPHPLEDPAPFTCCVCIQGVTTRHKESCC
jgi:hypothetical protein